MTPDEINAKHGKPSWRCNRCRAECGLHWWRGMSVAICNKPECDAAEVKDFNDAMAAEDNYQAYLREEGYL